MSTSQSLASVRTIVTPEFLRNPYPTYAQLCAEGPIHRVHLNLERWAVVRHAECSQFLRDPRLLSSSRVRQFLSALPAEERPRFAELERMIEMWMLFLDAPEHTRLRKLMNKGFSPAVVELLRTQVEEIVNEMLRPLANNADDIDLIRDLAYPLPVTVIAQMVGVPVALRRQFIGWTNTFAVLFGSQITMETVVAAHEAVVALTGFFREVVAERRKEKRKDLISMLIDIEEDGDVLTEEELYAQCVMLLFAGHETTRNLIGNGIYTLLKNPEHMAELRRTPEIIRTTVEELLRYESPVQFISRTAREELEIAGVRVASGDFVVFLLGAANRDPRRFEAPDQLNLRRVKNDHLAFGAGVHFCIGNQLARLEAQVAILKLLQQFPNVRLPDASREPEWVPNFIFRGLKHLAVQI